MHLEAIPIDGLPMVQSGDLIADLITSRIRQLDISLQDDDIVVVAQKIVSKAEGRHVHLVDIDPSSEALKLALEVYKDPRLVELILRESTEVVRRKPGVLIVRSRLGLVCANAGIDQSNIEHMKDGSALLLPEDPDASAESMRLALEDANGVSLGVVITDSANRPWRLGSVGIAIGVSNLGVLEDRRGETDLFGRELSVTMINRADAIASFAVLVMGESSEQIPVAVVRGVPLMPNKQDAKSILRPPKEDLFR